MSGLQISFCSERNIMSVLCHLLLVLCRYNGLQFSKTINGAFVWAGHRIKQTGIFADFYKIYTYFDTGPWTYSNNVHSVFLAHYTLKLLIHYFFGGCIEKEQIPPTLILKAANYVDTEI